MLPVWDVLVGSHFSLPRQPLADFYVHALRREILLDLSLGLEILPLPGKHLQARAVRLNPKASMTVQRHKRAL